MPAGPIEPADLPTPDPDPVPAEVTEDDAQLEDRVLVETFLSARDEEREQDMEAAFRMLLVRYQERVHKLVHRYVRDTLEAEDVTQEVFLKVFKKLDGFQWDAAFYTWLYRIAVNTAMDWTGKKRRRPVHLSEDVSDLVGQGQSDSDRSSLPGGRPASSLQSPPDEPLIREERAAIVRSVLDDLPEQYRMVLILREFEDLSYLEIAEVLGCSLGTVESRLFRARARFRQTLERRHPELLE